MELQNSEAEDLAYKYFDAGMNRNEWQREWDILKHSGNYEFTLGDLIIPTLAHCTSKDILIFNTNPESHSPIYVIKAATLANRSSDIEIPVIMAYDNSHYESLVPNIEEDIRKTIELKNVFLQGQYDKTNEDIPVLRKQNDIYKNSYAAALKKQSPIGKASKDTGKHK